MKRHVKCFSVLALIAFSLGYSDLLVRPCLAHTCYGSYDPAYEIDCVAHNFMHQVEREKNRVLVMIGEFYEWVVPGEDDVPSAPLPEQPPPLVPVQGTGDYTLPTSRPDAPGANIDSDGSEDDLDEEDETCSYPGCNKPEGHSGGHG